MLSNWLPITVRKRHEKENSQQDISLKPAPSWKPKS